CKRSFGSKCSSPYWPYRASIEFRYQPGLFEKQRSGASQRSQPTGTEYGGLHRTVLRLLPNVWRLESRFLFRRPHSHRTMAAAAEYQCGRTVGYPKRLPFPIATTKHELSAQSGLECGTGLWYSREGTRTCTPLSRS